MDDSTYEVSERKNRSDKKGVVDEKYNFVISKTYHKPKIIYVSLLINNN